MYTIEGREISQDKKERPEKVKQIVKTDDLNGEDKGGVEEYVNKCYDRSYLKENIFEPTTETLYKISLMDNVPVNTKQYRFAPVHRHEITKQVNDLVWKAGSK